MVALKGQLWAVGPSQASPIKSSLYHHQQSKIMATKVRVYTLLYLKWVTNKDLYSTGNSAQCYVAAWMGGEFGGERLHVYVWLSCFAVHLKLSQHC